MAGLCGCNQVFGLDDTALIGDADPCALHAGEPGFHDEDGDGHDDACDNCPGIPNPDQANSLEMANGAVVDQVGDACDPNPALAGDTIALFDTFADDHVTQRWDLVAGGWSFDGESLVYIAITSVYSGTAIDLLPSRWMSIFPAISSATRRSFSTAWTTARAPSTVCGAVLHDRGLHQI